MGSPTWCPAARCLQPSSVWFICKFLHIFAIWPFCLKMTGKQKCFAETSDNTIEAKLEILIVAEISRTLAWRPACEDKSKMEDYVWNVISLKTGSKEEVWGRWTKWRDIYILDLGKWSNNYFVVPDAEKVPGPQNWQSAVCCRPLSTRGRKLSLNLALTVWKNKIQLSSFEDRIGFSK